MSSRYGESLKCLDQSMPLAQAEIKADSLRSVLFIDRYGDFTPNFDSRDS